MAPPRSGWRARCANAPTLLCTNATLHQTCQCTNAPQGGTTGSAYAPGHQGTLLHPIAPYCTNAHHQGGAIGCVEALLAARARTTLMTSAGYSCLWIAAREGRTDIVQLLLKERRGLL